MLMVAKKYWWVGADDRPFRNLQARALSGRRSDLLAWLCGHEIALER
jgi:hypothetical protein